MFSERRKKPHRRRVITRLAGHFVGPFGTLCATLFIVLEPGQLHSSLSEEDNAEPPPEITPDPDRGFRRLVFAIILGALNDFTGSEDFQTHNQAKAFLFPESSDRQEYLRLLVECSGINSALFADHCESLRQRTVAPEGEATLNRFATERRARQRCQGDQIPRAVITT